MATEQTKFRFKGYRVTGSDVRINPDGEVDQKLTVTFSGVKYDISGSSYTLDLGASITNEGKSIKIRVELRGFFEFDTELTETDREMFFMRSAPAIMFPYLRAYVSTVTGIAGIEPIVLPTINFSEGLLKAKTEQA